MIAIQRDFVQLFFDKYLRGMDEGFPESAYARHPDWVARDDVSGLREWWLGQHPEDRTVEALLETAQGNVELSLYPDHAPQSVSAFHDDMKQNRFEGAPLRHTGHGGENDAVAAMASGEADGGEPSGFRIDMVSGRVFYAGGDAQYAPVGRVLRGMRFLQHSFVDVSGEAPSIFVQRLYEVNIAESAE